MDTDKIIRQEVIEYIETAELKIVKMMHAMLEVDANNDLWESIPDNIKEDLEAALVESDNGEVIPHAEIKKRYKKWLAK